MQIGFFVPWITKSRGGTENVGQMMANAMAGRGHGVTVFTFDDEAKPSRWPLNEAIELVRLPEAETPQVEHQMLLEVASRSLDLLVGLHMNRTFTRYVRCAHRAGVPIVLSEHIDPRFPNWIGTMTPVERQTAFFGATLVHQLTTAFRDGLAPGIVDRIRVVANTIPTPDETAQPGASGAGVKRLLTVARLVHRKRIGPLIATFATLAEDFPDWQLQVVGDGPQRRGLETLAAEAGIGDRVAFVGEVEDVNPYYRAAEAFVLPSLFEGFPMSSLEAMAHGLPLVGYAACNGINEQIVPGENGLLCRETHGEDALAAALSQIMSDAGLRQRMGRASIDRFQRHYRNDVIFDAWESMFREARDRGPMRTTPTAEEFLQVRLAEAVAGGPDVLTGRFESFSE